MTEPAAPAPAPQAAAAEKIPNYLVQAILLTIFCCLPFGIVAIVYAAQVNGKVAGGDIAGAQDSSAKAKKWCWLAFWLGLVSVVLSILLQFAVIGSAFMVEAS